MLMSDSFPKYYLVRRAGTKYQIHTIFSLILHNIAHDLKSRSGASSVSATQRHVWIRLLQDGDKICNIIMKIDMYNFIINNLRIS